MVGLDRRITERFNKNTKIRRNGRTLQRLPGSVVTTGKAERN